MEYEEFRKMKQGSAKTRLIKDKVLFEYYKNKNPISVITKLFGIGESNCMMILSKYGSGGRTHIEASKKIYSCDESYFEKIDCHEKAYWFGFICADGNIYNNKLQIGLAKKDEGHLDKFKKRIGYNGPLYNDKGSPKLIIARKKIVEDLKKLGLKENKSLFLDETIFDKIPKEFIWSAIHGYFDGDGSFGKRSKRVKNGSSYIFSLLGNENFLKFIVEKLKDRGMVFTAEPKKDKRTKSTFYISICMTEHRTKIIKELFYENGSKDFLERKRERLYA